MTADYFTEAEFREVSGDDKAPFRFSPADIARAQAEVERRFERWARMSFTTRTISQATRTNIPLVILYRSPIISVDAWSIDGTAYDPALLTIEADAATVRWGDWTGGSRPVVNAPGVAVFDYTYGFADVDGDGIVQDWSVKRPLIQAAVSLLDGEEHRGKIPRNARRYSSERTDIVLGGVGSTKPFPWDPRASDDVRSYVLPFRPITAFTTGPA